MIRHLHESEFREREIFSNVLFVEFIDVGIPCLDIISIPCRGGLRGRCAAGGYKKKKTTRRAGEKERKKTDNAREGWEDGTPPPHRDFKERCVVR